MTNSSIKKMVFSTIFLREIGLSDVDRKAINELATTINGEALWKKIIEERKISCSKREIERRQQYFLENAPDTTFPIIIEVKDGVLYFCPSCLDILPEHARLVNGRCDYCNNPDE